MRLLFLGGTRFVGLQMVRSALARGHQVTLFNRGRYRPDAFPDVETILGDRDSEISKLAGRRWDGVIDVCGWVPRHVRDSARQLASQVEHYTYVSTVSVYADLSPRPMHEGQPLGTLADETVEKVTNETYGPLKALCERMADEAMPGRVLHIRPGLVVGPEDYTDRFTYWPRRLRAGGRVLAPGTGEEPVQFIDGRDLAEFTLDRVEQRALGAYNCTGPGQPLTLRRLLDRCQSVLGTDARITWVPEPFLDERQAIAPWSLPLWVPAGKRGIFMIDCRKAIAAGLRCRPLEETVVDLLAWDATRPAEQRQNAGLTPEAEAELLAAWTSPQP